MAAPLLYLDPGTGSLLLYALFGIGATLLFSLKGLWYKIRVIFNPAIRTKHDLPDYVFHSEGGKHWQVFHPVIKAFNEQGIPCAYITPDKDDPAFSEDFKNLQVINPGNEMATIAYMNHLKAKVVVSTTPHLDIYMLRRSRQVNHYSHLFHSPTDVSFYEKYAFDYYDSLLTVGPFQEGHVRFLEKRRGTKEKTLFPVGNSYFDYQKNQLKEIRAKGAKGQVHDQPVLLYAPTWGMRSSLVKYDGAIITDLADQGFKVIFRPHPQSWISHKELMEHLERELKDRPEIEWDKRKTGMESMEKADAMITDVSGVLFDYAFLFEKPVILMNSDVSKGGFEAEDLPEEWDVPSCRALSRVIEADEVGELPGIVRKVLEDRSLYSDRVRDFRENHIYNFGNAGQAACEALICIRKGLAN